MILPYFYVMPQFNTTFSVFHPKISGIVFICHLPIYIYTHIPIYRYINTHINTINLGL